MNKHVINEWRQFLKEDPTPQEISDEVLQLIFSNEISKILEKGTLSEGLADRARSMAKKYAIPVGIAMSILSGAMSAKEFANYQNKRNAEIAAQADAPKPGDYAYHRSGSKPPGYSDLGNKESIEKAWQDIEGLKRTRAPVSGTAPTLIGGEIKVLRFAYIPTQEMNPTTVLPMSGMTAEGYREMLEARLARSPQELIYLKNMIFGDTGKWASGVGEEVFKVEGNYAILPPEWSIAHEVYANAVEERLFEMVKHVKENPENNQEIFQQLNVKDEQQFDEFISDQLYKIGRR